MPSLSIYVIGRPQFAARYQKRRVCHVRPSSQSAPLHAAHIHRDPTSGTSLSRRRGDGRRWGRALLRRLAVVIVGEVDPPVSTIDRQRSVVSGATWVLVRVHPVWVYGVHIKQSWPGSALH